MQAPAAAAMSTGHEAPPTTARPHRGRPYPSELGIDMDSAKQLPKLKLTVDEESQVDDDAVVQIEDAVPAGCVDAEGKVPKDMLVVEGMDEDQKAAIEARIVAEDMAQVSLRGRS